MSCPCRVRECGPGEVRYRRGSGTGNAVSKAAMRLMTFVACWHRWLVFLCNTLGREWRISDRIEPQQRASAVAVSARLHGGRHRACAVTDVPCTAAACYQGTLSRNEERYLAVTLGPCTLLRVGLSAPGRTGPRRIRWIAVRGLAATTPSCQWIQPTGRPAAAVRCSSKRLSHN